MTTVIYSEVIKMGSCDIKYEGCCKTTRMQVTRRKYSYFVALFTLSVTVLSIYFNWYHYTKPIQSKPDSKEFNQGNKSRKKIQSNNHRKQLCSFPILQEAVNNVTGYLSADGTWKKNFKKQFDEFEPTICKYKYAVEWPVNVLKLCLNAKQIKNIVIIGDSNALKYQEALARNLNRNEYKCQVISTENNVSFYVTDDVSLTDIRKFNRSCRRCRSTQITCLPYKPTASDVNIDVKYLVMEYTNDSEIMTPRSRTTQEFLFTEYLKGAKNVPDLLMLFSNSHDHNRLTLTEFRKSLRFLLDIMEDHLPPSTRVILLSKPSFCEPRQPVRWRHVKIEGKYSTNEWMRMANEILYSETKSQFINKGRPWVYFDIYGLIDPVQQMYNEDGIHLTKFWYNHIISYILQTFCADQL